MKTLISIFMGISIAFAIEVVFPLEQNLKFSMLKLGYALIFFTNIVRFFEGNIILYEKMREKDPNPIKQRAFVLFIMLQFVTFCAMGRFIGNLVYFIISLIILFFLDLIWANPIFNKGLGELYKTTKVWFFTSLPLLIISLFLLLNTRYKLMLPISNEPSTILVLFFSCMIIGTIDYVYNWKFFFDKEAMKAISSF